MGKLEFRGVNKKTAMDELVKFCNMCSRIWLYGAGDYGEYYYNVLLDNNIKPHGFIETNKNKSLYCETVVYSLDEMLAEIKKNDGIILAVSEAYQIQICKQLPKCIKIFRHKWYDINELYNSWYDEMLYKKISPVFLHDNFLSRIKYSETVMKKVTQCFNRIINNDGNILSCLINPYVTWYKDEHIQQIKVRGIGICVQGPILKNNDFTLKAILYYREIYPFVPIVVSTWDGEIYDYFRKKCIEHNIVILENKLPPFPGGGNVNYQLLSSKMGIKYISENCNVEHVLKVRTDWLIGRNDFLISFDEIQQKYKLGKDNVGLNERILAFGFSVTPFFIDDCMTYGDVSDMLKLYSIKYDLNKNVSKFLRVHRDLSSRICRQMEMAVQSCNDYKIKKLSRILMKLYVAEMYIWRKFYNDNIEKINVNEIMMQYENFLANYLVIGDLSSYSVYWNKYATYHLKCLDTNDRTRWLQYVIRD